MGYADWDFLGDVETDTMPDGDAEPVANLDDAVRALGEATKNTFAVQHVNSDGTHQPGLVNGTFVGVYADFPTPGASDIGCTAIATDEGEKPYHWDGLSWVATTGAVGDHRTIEPIDHPPRSVGSLALADSSVKSQKIGAGEILSSNIDLQTISKPNILDKAVGWDQIDDIIKAFVSPVFQRFGGNGELGDVEITSDVSVATANAWVSTDGVVKKQFRSLNINIAAGSKLVECDANTYLCIIGVQGTFSIQNGNYLSLIGRGAQPGTADAEDGDPGYGATSLTTAPFNSGGGAGAGGDEAGSTKGGDGGNAGGVGGTANLVAPADGSAVLAQYAAVLKYLAKSGAILFSYGGGGGSGKGATRGIGGRGGGAVYIECDTLDLNTSGLITAAGYPGANASGGNCGGGGGGGGGTIIIICRNIIYSNLTTQLLHLGGSGGSASGSGGAGGDGGGGKHFVVILDLDDGELSDAVTGQSVAATLPILNTEVVLPTLSYA